MYSVGDISEILFVKVNWDDSFCHIPSPTFLFIYINFGLNTFSSKAHVHMVRKFAENSP